MDTKLVTYVVILDLIISPIVMKTKLGPTSSGPYILDHLAGELDSRMEKDKLKGELIKYRDTKDICAEHIFWDVHPQVSDTDNVDDLVEEFNKQVIKCLDNCAPKIEKSIIAHMRKPWYPSEIR